MILKHSILQLLKEYEVINLSELATRLQTSEGHVRVTIEQMMDSGTPVRLKDDIVYVSRKRELLPFMIVAFLVGVIVILPAMSGWN